MWYNIYEGVIGTETKVCSICKIAKPRTIEYFQNNKVAKDGLAGYCRECVKIKARQYYKDNKENMITQQMKRYYDKKDAIVLQQKQYNQNHRELILEYKKQYRLDHAGAIAEYKKQWAKDNKESISEHKKQYARDNREVYIISGQRRRARVRSLPATLTAQQWKSCKEHFNNCCAYCEKSLPLAQEHVVPVVSSGGYTHNNIIPACGICNSSKATKSFFTWYPRQEFYSRKQELAILKFLNYKDRTQQFTLAL